jgi:hypothetical protein
MLSEIKKPLLFIGLAGILLIGIFKVCDKRKIDEITKETLKPGERSAIIIDSTKHRITEIKRSNPTSSGKSTTVTRRIDANRETRISVDETGNLSILTRNKGFIREFGFVGGYGNPGFRLGADCQVYFIRNWGINLGLTTTLKYNIKPFVAVSYTLSGIELYNTSVLIGIDSRKNVFAGVRVRL